MAATATVTVPTSYEVGTVDFPVMWVTLAWIKAHCVVPDGFDKGKPFVLQHWQAWYFANFYRVKRKAGLILAASRAPAIGAPAFFYRRAQTVMPQKSGKGPKTAAHVCAEAVGPTMFSGWAQAGQEYVCEDHGCHCGWVYVYAPGEAMGIPRPTPLIQITAYSAEQTDNIYDSLRPMIENGPLAEMIPKTGEEFIRLPNDGRIDTVTSSHQSRLGQRVTFVPQDETGIWLKQNKMDQVSKTQRRGAAGMQGRTSEDTNGWDPTENSVAQSTASAALRVGDIFRLHPQAPAHLRYTNREDRARIHRYVYRGCPWVDLDTIMSEAEEILLEDPANAERFFGNRCPPGLGTWLPDGWWKGRQRKGVLVPERVKVGGGFDGSESSDWTAIRLEVIGGPLDGYRFTPRYGPDRRPAHWDPNDWGGTIPRDEVDAAMDEIARRYRIMRFYADPKDWYSEIGAWSVRIGDEIVFEWATWRIIQMYAALSRLYNDLKSGRTYHDDDPLAEEHAGNARKVAKPGDRYILAKPHPDRHIDIVMADTLAHEAACDFRELPVDDKPDGTSHTVHGFN